MRGIILYTIPHIGWIAIRNENGEVTLAELMGKYEIKKGDAITGNLHALGHEVFINHSAGEYLDVFVQHVRLTERQTVDVIRACKQKPGLHSKKNTGGE